MVCCVVLIPGRSEVRVRQPEGVERRVAPVVPQQLLLQEAHGVQREHDGLVLQQTVDVQAWWGRLRWRFRCWSVGAGHYFLLSELQHSEL